MGEIEVLKICSDAMEMIDTDAQRRVLNYLNDRYLKTGSEENTDNNQFIEIDDLNLNPEDRNSAKSYAKVYELRRDNNKIKCLIAVCYMTCYLSKDDKTAYPYPITIDHVAMFYKEVGWDYPSDLRNTLARTGSDGWLDTSRTSNLTVTNKGRDLLNDPHTPEYSKYFKSKTIQLEPASYNNKR